MRMLILRILILIFGAIVFSACGADKSATGAVTGQVTYLERIALPPDAVVTVQLINASLADTPAAVIAETSTPTEGGQVPIDFEITYEAQEINPNNLYTLSATIRDGNRKLLFVTDQAVLVITDGNPSDDVELVLIQVP